MSTWKSVIAGHFGYPQPEDNHEWVSAVYDISNGCSTCGIGKIQINPFRLKGIPKIKQNHFFCLNWVNDEIFTSDAVKKFFEAEKITGIKFIHPISHKTGSEIADYWQIIITDCLNSNAENKNLIEEKCEMPTDPKLLKFLKANGSKLIEGPFCGKKKFNYPQNKGFIYKKETFADCKDFIKSSEWFGSGGSSGKAIFISEKVYQIVVRNKFRGMFFNEVQLI